MMNDQILTLIAFCIGVVPGFFLALLIFRARNTTLEAEIRERAGIEVRALRQQLESEQVKSGQTGCELKDLVRELEQSRIEAAGLKEKAEQALGLKTEHVRVRQELTKVREQASIAQATAAALQNELTEKKGDIIDLKQIRQELDERLQILIASEAELKKELERERRESGEKLDILQQARKELTLQFEDTANKILENKTRRFTVQNQENLNQLLEPLKTKLTEFKDQVEKTYDNEGRQRSALTAEVRQLMNLNKQLSDDAKNLTRALTGQSKTRGDWGEMILERILESAGLQKGREYQTQQSHTNQDGRRIQPDVIINLPKQRYLIIDSKVSLNAYLEFTDTDDKQQQENAIKNHLSSVKAHIAGLASKDYQQLYGSKSPDFVIMFVPIEPAFLLATSKDLSLWESALKQNIMLVSPSTLLFVLRTVSMLWQQANQTKNAEKIATRGELLLEKFADFVKDLEIVGKKIKEAQHAHDKAKNKLATGRGNLISQTEKMKELGIKIKKELPQDMVETAIQQDKLQLDP